jgi:hypothetical protein
VRIDSEFDERRFVRRLWMRKNAPVLRMRLQGSAQRGRTITCRFPTRLASPGLTMDVPGGIVERPAHKLGCILPAHRLARPAWRVAKIGPATTGSTDGSLRDD